MPSSFRVVLPTSMRDWVRNQVRRRGYHSADDYVLELLRHDQLREARDRVDAVLLQALDSGEPAEMTARDWQHIRSQGRKRAAARRRTSG